MLHNGSRTNGHAVGIFHNIVIMKLAFFLYKQNLFSLCEITVVPKQRKSAEGNILTLKGWQTKRWILRSKELYDLLRPDSVFKVC
jgi:hypothetical protein